MRLLQMRDRLAAQMGGERGEAAANEGQTSC